jgi:predicted GNAT family N-acyltransferase
MEISVRKINDEPELSQAFEIRKVVFIREQKVPVEEEFDLYDEESEHYLAYYSDTPCGVARWRFTDLGNSIKLERYAVLKEFRNKGVGSALVKKTLEDALEVVGCDKIYLNAQLDAVPLYQRFGFVPVGEVFLECDIKHLQMELR